MNPPVYVFLILPYCEKSDKELVLQVFAEDTDEV